MRKAGLGNLTHRKHTEDKMEQRETVNTLTHLLKLMAEQVVVGCKKTNIVTSYRGEEVVECDVSHTLKGQMHKKVVSREDKLNSI